MAKITKKIAVLLITAAIALFSLTGNACAADARSSASYFTQNGNSLICIAHRGDWHSYPENSAEAVMAAADYGVVSVDIKLTADKKPVLMADDDIYRMCVNSDGSSAKGTVDSYTLEELRRFCLLAGNGADRTLKTDFHPASLEDALNAVGDDAALMLNLSCSDFKTVCEYVSQADALDRVVFRFSDSNKRIIQTVKGIDGINVCGNYQGNIIFLATSAVKECFNNRINTIELGSTNGHGVLYDDFLMKRFKSDGKAMVSMVNGRCGKRTDNEKGWDDLISRGYSIIETDYPKELSEYIASTQSAGSELERFLSLYENTDLSVYTTDSESKFNSALENARDILSHSSSLSDIENARYELQSAHDNLIIGAKKAVTLSFKITPGRIAVVVLCGAAVVISQILLYKRRKKND